MTSFASRHDAHDHDDHDHGSHDDHDDLGHDDHDHGDHDHDHSHDFRDASRRSLLIALALITSYMIAEVIGGLFSGSLALLADAGHMLTDAAAIAMALIAMWIAQRPPLLSAHSAITAPRFSLPLPIPLPYGSSQAGYSMRRSNGHLAGKRLVTYME